MQDTNFSHMISLIQCQGWKPYKSECKWEYMCDVCNRVPKPIDEDDEYDNLVDNKLSLPQDGK